MPPVSPSDTSSGFPSEGELVAVAHAADALADVSGGAVLGVRAPFPGPGALVGWPLRGRRPLALLLGYTAPADWRAIGVTAPGRAIRTGGTDDVVVTSFIGRGGEGATLLRRGDEVTRLPGRPDGPLADACRRAIGVPTPSPPRSTVGLWTMTWLDRVVEAAASGEDEDLTWHGVALRHPACSEPLSPAALAAAAHALADAWPWPQLRAAPEVLDVPGPVPAGRVADWMDDGMWARWVLGGFPALDDLVSACRSLLAPTVADGVELVVAAGDPSAT
jgi:hypothetical protein